MRKKALSKNLPLPKFKTSSCENYVKAKERISSTPQEEMSVAETYISMVDICN